MTSASVAWTRRDQGRVALSALAIAASLLCGGCHQDMVITGKVTIPVSVQNLFSQAQPGNVELFPSKAGGAVAVRYLCDPTNEPIVVEYVIRDENCADEQLVQASAFRVKPDRVARVRCGERGGSSGGAEGEELAFASAPVFQGQTGCESGEASVDLTLAPR